MFILLPDNPDTEGILKLEANLTSDNVKLLFSTLKKEVVNLRLPRFQIGSDTGTSIATALKAIGLVDIFDEARSDLTLMSPEHSLHLTSIAHRATFSVTEKGTTRTKKVTPTKKETIKTSTFGQKYFEVDHPFMFMVWDYYSGMFLLMGRVMNPDIIPS
jgi:serpin B